MAKLEVRIPWKTADKGSSSKGKFADGKPWRFRFKTFFQNCSERQAIFETAVGMQSWTKRVATPRKASARPKQPLEVPIAGSLQYYIA